MKWFKRKNTKTIKKCNIEILATNDETMKYPNVDRIFVQHGFLRIDDDDSNSRYLINLNQIRGININNFTVEVNKQ